MREFAKSLKDHPSGYDFRLVVIAKGWENGSLELAQVKELVESLGGGLLSFPDNGYDWGAYIRISPQLCDDFVCFLNSHSRINCDLWLSHLVSAVLEPGVGMAGATGSYGTWAFSFPYFDFRLPYLFAYPLKTVRSLIGALLHCDDSIRFPFAHLRSNAFIIKSTLFMEYCLGKPIPNRKSAAHKFETGRQSLTKFIQDKGLGIVVVGRDGRAYSPDQWIESRTFRVPGQTNLLISDNQTDAYCRASSHKKRGLEWAAWKHTFTP